MSDLERWMMVIGGTVCILAVASLAIWMMFNVINAVQAIQRWKRYRTDMALLRAQEKETAHYMGVAGRAQRELADALREIDRLKRQGPYRT